MAEERSSGRKVTPENLAKNLTMLLAGTVLGVLLPILQSASAPKNPSVFHSPFELQGPRWWVLLVQFQRLVFGNYLVQILYVCLFVALMILRPNQRYAWIYALIVGYAIPILIFHSVG